MKYALYILALVGVFSLVGMMYFSEPTGMATRNSCPVGMNEVYVSHVNGGLQLAGCQVGPVSQVGRTFNTYTSHPQGDVRRQNIAFQGDYSWVDYGRIN